MFESLSPPLPLPGYGQVPVTLVHTTFYFTLISDIFLVWSESVGQDRRYDYDQVWSLDQPSAVRSSTYNTESREQE